MSQRSLLDDAESILGNQRPGDSLGNNLCCVKCGVEMTPWVSPPYRITMQEPRDLGVLTGCQATSRR